MRILVIEDRIKHVPDHRDQIVVYPSLHVDSWLILGPGINTERDSLPAALATVGNHIEKNL